MHIEWKADYNTGVVIVDTQHQQLVALLNQHFDKESSVDLYEMFQMLGDFNAYAMRHFDTESHLIQEAGLTESSLWLLHSGEHDYYRQRIDEFRLLAQGQPDTTASRLMSFLRYWWLDHIQVNDKKLMQSLLTIKQTQA